MQYIWNTKSTYEKESILFQTPNFFFEKLGKNSKLFQSLLKFWKKFWVLFQTFHQISKPAKNSLELGESEIIFQELFQNCFDVLPTGKLDV